MDALFQNIIIGVIVVGAAVYLINLVFKKRRSKKACSHCPVIKASRGKKLT